MKTALQIIGLGGVVAALLIMGIGVGIMHSDAAANGGIVLFLGSAALKTWGHMLKK
jgi:hypothetical protein